MRIVACLILFCSIVPLSAGDWPSTLAWQTTDPIVAADFDWFPDDPDGARRLASISGRDREKLPPSEILSALRLGLRRADRRVGEEWLKWVGRDQVTGARDRQDPRAIELLYHASAHAAYSYVALYYGLSRVQPKTPALLRRFVEIAMDSRDWINVIGHTAWAGQGNTNEMLSFLAPYLSSDAPEIRAHAAVLQRIYSGELTAHEQWAKVHTERAIKNFGNRMDSFRGQLTDGDSKTRLEVLQLISRNVLWLIMDDDWIAAFRAAASDPVERVRREVAIQVGTRWFWQGKRSETIPQGAIDLLIALSRDESTDVRSNVDYYGFRRAPKNEALQARRREMEAENVERQLARFREHVLAAIAEGRFQQVEDSLHEIRPGMKEGNPESTRRQVTAFVQDIEARLAAARRASNKPQARTDAAEAGRADSLDAEIKP